MSLTKPNYLDVTPPHGEVLPFVEKLHDDSELDAVVVRGALERLSSEAKAQLLGGVTKECGRFIGAEIGKTLLGLIVPDLEEVKAFVREASTAAAFDYSVEGDDDILARDDTRIAGQGTYSHIDLPLGLYGSTGSESLRVVNTFSVGAGAGSARFLVKRLGSYYRPDDIFHRVVMDYLMTDLVEEIEEAKVVHEDGWAITQRPGDIVIIPQFDRPSVHQVVADPDRSSYLYSTFAVTHYAAYNSTPGGIARPYLAGVGIAR